MHLFIKKRLFLLYSFTILPLSRCRIDDAKQLVVGNSFRLQIIVQRLPLLVVVGSVQCLPDLWLSRTGDPYDEHRVPDRKQLLQLYNLVNKQNTWVSHIFTIIYFANFGKFWTIFSVCFWWIFLNVNTMMKVWRWLKLQKWNK